MQIAKEKLKYESIIKIRKKYIVRNVSFKSSITRDSVVTNSGALPGSLSGASPRSGKDPPAAACGERAGATLWWRGATATYGQLPRLGQLPRDPLSDK